MTAIFRCSPPSSLPLLIRVNFPVAMFRKWMIFLRIGIAIQGQWLCGPDPSLAYLARLIWSHLPLLYYTHCVMVER